jgi:hypothetical protein
MTAMTPNPTLNHSPSQSVPRCKKKDETEEMGRNYFRQVPKFIDDCDFSSEQNSPKHSEGKEKKSTKNTGRERSDETALGK